MVEYARAVVEDAVDVDADFFQKFRDAMSFRAIMQSQHPYIIGVAISDILKKRVFSRRSTFLFNSDDIVKSISVTGELCGYAFYAFSKVIALERDEFSDVVRDALLAASGSEAFNRDKASLNEEVAAAKRLLILLRVYEEYLAAVLFDYRDELIRRLVDEEGKIIVESSITQEDIDNIIGILSTKALTIEARKKSFENLDIRSLLTPAYFVPENRRTDALFREMQQKKEKEGVYPLYLLEGALLLFWMRDS